MKTNLGSADRILRIIIAVAIFILYFTNIITGTLGIVLMVAGVVLALTGFISFCPLYYMLGIRTNEKKQ